MTCKDHCIHYPVCKDTVADENWTDEALDWIKRMFSPADCKNFMPSTTAETTGTWTYYSTTMMECSICGRHVAKHRYEFCPHCGTRMNKEKVRLKPDTSETWEQLEFPIHTGEHSR
jgi:DNA-directed RNA polymerase subunit RPC12/RpoP